MRSAADCRPRLSPPAASPATSAAMSLSASVWPSASAKACAEACSTCGPASMLPARLKCSCTMSPHQSTQSVPVCTAGWPRHGSTCNCRCALPASAWVSAATTAAASCPAASSARPAGPYIGLTKAWVAMAPTSARVCTHSAPTAKKRLAMATPSRPLRSRARIDQVIGGPGLSLKVLQSTFTRHSSDTHSTLPILRTASVISLASASQ